MKKYVFLFKEKENDDRDCVKYIEIDDLEKNHKDIINHFNIHGACFSKSLKADVSYDNIITILTENEYMALCNPQDMSDEMREFIIEKLRSEENKALFDEVQKEEIEYLMEEFDLTLDDVFAIFDEYYLDYRDRGIVGCVYIDSTELAYEEADDFMDIPERMKMYFDYKKYGEDLVNDCEYFFELDDGRVVYLNY